MSEEKNIDNNIELQPSDKVGDYVKNISIKNDKEAKNDLQLTQKPDFLLPQFNSIEEQAKSYKELQALQTKQAQELAMLKKNNNSCDVEQNAMNILNNLKKDFSIKQRNTQNLYLQELQNLKRAFQNGKISQQEFLELGKELKIFFAKKLENINNLFKNQSQQYDKLLDLTSPTEFFAQELQAKNYLSVLTDFLDKNYKKLPKSQLNGIKNLASQMEQSIRDEILNEMALQKENQDYRQQLSSATNFSSQPSYEKIYTLKEIKNMSPSEFKKNQQAILEQFVARKIH